MAAHAAEGPVAVQDSVPPPAAAGKAELTAGGAAKPKQDDAPAPAPDHDDDDGGVWDSASLYEEILDGWKQRGQPYHPNTWRVRHLLAWVYARNGNLPKGAELFEANVTAAPSSFNAYLSVDALREAEAKLGRDDKALVDRARQALAAAIGNRGVGYKSWVTGHARVRLGQQLLRMKEHAEAEATLQRLLVPRPEDLAVAGTEVVAAEAAVAKARADATLSRVVAPIGGTILKIYARPGDQVGGDGLLDMADLTRLDIVADVYETDPAAASGYGSAGRR